MFSRDRFLDLPRITPGERAQGVGHYSCHQTPNILGLQGPEVMIPQLLHALPRTRYGKPIMDSSFSPSSETAPGIVPNVITSPGPRLASSQLLAVLYRSIKAIIHERLIRGGLRRHYLVTVHATT